MSQRVSNLEQAKRQILDRIDLVEFIRQYVNLKRAGQRWVGLCPFHGEKTPSFTVSSERGIFKCFGCGVGGDIFRFVQLKENVDFMDALRLLADRAGVELSSREAAGQSGPDRRALYAVNDWARLYFQRLLCEARGEGVRAYLEQRGLAPASIERFAIGFAPGDEGALRSAARTAGYSETVLVAADLMRQSDSGRTYDTFRQRLMFPIRDAQGRTVGFGGRTLVDDKAKYINTRQNTIFDKGSGLYGIDMARSVAPQRGRAILVEGYTDCIAAHQAGFEETVATLGTALTDEQVRLLRRYCDNVVLMFDSDTAGEAAADRAIMVAMPRQLTVRLARIPEGKDPCDFLQREPAARFAAVLNEAADALQFKWAQTQRRFLEHGSTAGRRDCVHDFLGVVGEAFRAGAVDTIQRGLIVNQVAQMVAVPVDQLHRELDRIAQQQNQGAARTAAKAGGPADGSGTGTVASSCTSLGDAAWKRLLGVTLNESGWLGSEDFGAYTELATDALVRRLAELVVALHERLGDFTIEDVLAADVTGELVEYVSSFAFRGQTVGNFEATVREAAAQLRCAKELKDIHDRKKHIGSRSPGDAETQESSEALESLAAALAGRSRHPVPPRLRSRPRRDE